MPMLLSDCRFWQDATFLMLALKIQCFAKMLSDSRFLEGNWMNVLFVGCAALLAYFIYKKLSSLGVTTTSLYSNDSDWSGCMMTD